MATLKIEGIAKLNKGLKKRMDMSAVQTVVRKNGADMQKKAQECSSRYWNTEKKYRY